MSIPFKQIQVIINPAAGQDEPVLNTLNQVFQQYEIKWQVAITQEAGDAERLTREAVANGADLVAGYGGDGTLMEVVNGLRNSEVPLGILPGGTANGLARDLAIPLDLAQAAELLCQGGAVRQIDLGLMDGVYFMLHAYAGLKPEQAADRETKDKLGLIAYLGTILQVVKEPTLSQFRLSIDGREIEQQGVICVVVNALGWGFDLPFQEPIKFDDGLLDVFIINKDVNGLLESVRSQKMSGDIFQHWQGRRIEVESDPVQDIWIDGEAGQKTPFTAKIAPKALRVVVPEG